MDENLQFHKPKAGQAESRQTVFPITVGFPIPEDAEGVEGVETVSRESLFKDMSNPSGLDHLYEMQCYNMFNMDITKDDFDSKTLHQIVLYSVRHTNLQKTYAEIQLALIFRCVPIGTDMQTNWSVYAYQLVRMCRAIASHRNSTEISISSLPRSISSRNGIFAWMSIDFTVIL